MDWLTIIIMAFCLAMDCSAVSAVQGLCEGKWHQRAVLLALIFGLFHAGMPLVGYYVGSLFVDFFHRYAPWIALVLLGGVGGKSIWESLQHEHGEKKRADWSIRNMLILAIATSIDVLTTGLIMIPYPDWIFLAVATIGCITFACSLIGYLIGVYFGQLKWNMELVGGVVLILLGIKICVEGLCS